MKKKLLIVDDSFVYRNAVKKSLAEFESEYDFLTAKDGQEATEIFKANLSELVLVVMDIEMPVLDGVGATKAMRAISTSVPIIVFAAPTLVGAKKALDAISFGANEFVKKFDQDNQNTDQIKDDLLPKIRSFLSFNKKPLQKEVQKTASIPSAASSRLLSEKIKNVSLICIGSSTGGPDILRKIFAGLKEPLRVPVLMVQHMPPVFTQQFAGMCAKISGQKVVECGPREVVKPGHFYLAPGDYHMVAKNSNRLELELTQTEKVCSVRPAFDVLIRSLDTFPGPILYIVLTGMGEDGMKGLKATKKARDIVIVQDKESAVVWGMPGAVHDAGLADAVVPGIEIPQYINYLKL